MPDFAISQRCFLVISPSGNILWDCIPLLDEITIEFIKSKRGIKAIAISHPHYYSTMNNWAQGFNCPIYIHCLDESWAYYKSSLIHFWKGLEFKLGDGISILNIGGHFPGSCILNIPFLSSQGTILCDSLYISRNKKHIAVMHSYPNQILLTEREFISFVKKTQTLVFDELHGAFEGQSIISGARDIFYESIKKYQACYEIWHLEK